MGIRMAPSYGNLFMGKFEQQAIDNSLLKPFIWWRFIDDIFMIWTHGEEHLISFIGFLNSIHPSIKCTHECNCGQTFSTRWMHLHWCTL